MGVFLFDKIIFGPVKSRRLGVSLGINLLPVDEKFCNFNCIYCECGWSKEIKEQNIVFHDAELVVETLEMKLDEMKLNNEPLDVITYAGNGEPTLHPKFDFIIEETIRLRNEFFPKAKIAVLSNATTLHNAKKVAALKLIDQNILKLDSAFIETINLLNAPQGKYDLNKLIKQFISFEGNLIIQTMFVKGTYNQQTVDNSTDLEVNAWLQLIEKVKPKQVMIYTIARDTPVDTLEKVSMERLNEIAEKVKALGIDVQVSG